MAVHDPLVGWVVRRQWLGPLSFAEALQAGRIGLWHALRRYDLTRGTRFSTYAVPAIARAVWDEVAAAHVAPVRAEADLVRLVEETDLSEALHQAQVGEALHALVAALPTRLRVVVVPHHGLDGTPPQSFAALGEASGSVANGSSNSTARPSLCWLTPPPPVACEPWWIGSGNPTTSGPWPVSTTSRELPGGDPEGAPMSTPSAPAPCASASVAPTASQKWAAHPAFAQWSLAALAPHLPLRFPVPADLPPSPKRRYRSGYRPPDPTPLADPTALATKSDLEIAQLLVDFSPLEALLAQYDRPSHKGQVPFRPVSLFLAICLRRERVLSWQGVAQLLASTHGAAWRALFGFVVGVTPSASGLRFFFQAVGTPVFDDLCPRFAALLRTADLLPTHSTYPGDPPDQGVTVSQDGMLHAAHDLSHCFFATAACYQARPERPVIPLTPVATPRAASAMLAPVPAPAPVPTPPAPVRARPCSAQEKGHAGCPCVSPTCQDHCERASPTDREARFIHYQGHNAKHGETKGAKGKGRAVFGYRSIVERVLDDRFAIAWTVRSSLYPANTDERTVFRERVHALQQALPDLPIGEWLDDAGVGYGPCLAAIWELGAFRLVDIRADKSDADPEACRHRGYDAFGRPLCPHGYSLRANGYDHQRRRAKYVCTQACRREPLTPDGPIAPVAGCPFLDPVHRLGVIVNVGKTLPDGSTRLAREIPYGSDAWKARYGRRNLSESRNSQVEAVDLKRLPSSGLARGAKEIQLADFLINLRTVGWLVREASTR